MSSLLATLTRLSQGRGEEGGEWEDSTPNRDGPGVETVEMKVVVMPVWTDRKGVAGVVAPSEAGTAIRTTVEMVPTAATSLQKRRSTTTAIPPRLLLNLPLSLILLVLKRTFDEHQHRLVDSQHGQHHPTSEHPGTGFYDKILVRTTPHVRCATEPASSPRRGTRRRRARAWFSMLKF